MGEDDVRTRLQTAALTLLSEHGYDRTKAADIAARAGVTERTFFRYFADKREVLFGGEAAMRAGLIAAVADAPAGEGVLATLLAAFRSLESAHHEARAYLRQRHAVIAATPALHERELAKLAALTDALAIALRARGVAETRAELAARIGMAAFVQATLAWLATDERLGDELDRVFAEVAALSRDLR